MDINKAFYKKLSTSNPLLSNVFCADPTGVEYKGRLYIYGTNDHQQYDGVGDNGKNTYELIKSIVCFSTEDMTNWTYHGAIDVSKVAPWVYAAWAPSIISREEDDGLTHFYLYFSNSGAGVGVLTSTNPEGPWSSPLNGPLIHDKMKALSDVPHPFDPGACIDDSGTGWLTFGGGVSPCGNDVLPGTARIVRLGKDLISLDSDFVEIKAPYFYEASELNFINGTYVYTFNNNWVDRTEWNYDSEKASACSMAYMTSKTPLVSDSWKYEGHYFKNPGEQGLNYSNNHTHFLKFKGEWYLFYHTLTLQEEMPTNGGFRSICADKLSVNEADVKITLSPGTRNGVEQIDSINPYEKISGTTMFTSAKIGYENNLKAGNEETLSCSLESGAWIMIKGVDFSKNNKTASKLIVNAKGKGNIEVRLDKPSCDNVTEFSIDSDKITEYNKELLNISGKHDVVFVFSENIVFESWRTE